MALGAALILAALSLFLWNQQEARRAGSAAMEVLPKVIDEIQGPDSSAATETQFYPDPYDPEMTVVEIDSNAYIGYLSIPAIDLELPVMSEWDYARLKLSPCRYTGSTKTDNLVIAAHNYRQHFGRLSDLSPGDQVLFTDMDGKTWAYEVAVTEVLTPTAIEDMTASGYDLTLFTCTYGGGNRVTVRCDRLG